VPQLTRRSFLALFTAAAAGYVVGDYDPTQLAWFAPKALAPALEQALVDLPPPGTQILGRPMPAPVLTLTQLTQMILRELVDKLQDPRFTLFDHVERLGDTGRKLIVPAFTPEADGEWDPFAPITCTTKDVVLDQQYGCQFVMTPEFLGTSVRRHERELTEAIARAWVRPIAHVLANQVRAQGLTCFGTLDLPTSVDQACRASDKRSGLSIRALRQYDMVDGLYRTRIDILGGRG
jgi:hypothetical protein